MVKSRRAASSRQSVAKATVARRPSVLTSRRSVVTSTCRPAGCAVTVPWSIPVGMARMPACLEPGDDLAGPVQRGGVDVA